MNYRELGVVLQDYLRNGKGIRYIVCPFINSEIVTDLLPPQCDAIIITSWRKDHLRTGISSLDLYDVCREHNWTLFVNDRLHMKLYSNNLDSAWVGSANLTKRALSDDERSNHELLAFIEEMTTDDRIMIHQIQAEATLVTDDVFQQYKQWFDEQQPVVLPPPESVEIDARESAFHTSQLPHSDSPQRLWDVANGATDLREYEQAAMEHDLGLYPVLTNQTSDEFIDNMNAVFFEHPFIKAFADEITTDGIRFGGVKQWIKKNCTDVPVPHARELTFPTQALIRWFPALEPEEYEIYQPNVSEILRRKN